MNGSVSKIETSGFVDGPGIRTVVFLNGCKLRCKFCHNPEMWNIKDVNMTVDEVVSKVLKNKEYFGNRGGVTFSGGEPLIQSKFLIEACKKLKQANIHIALDTSGVGNSDYEEILKYIDLVILDIKDVSPSGYQELTGYSINESLKFIDTCNKLNKKIWIRQVIIPNRNDNQQYIKLLAEFLIRIKNIKKIEFLPFHKLGSMKYGDLGLIDPYKDIPAMDKIKCDELYNLFIKYYEKIKLV